MAENLLELGLQAAQRGEKEKAITYLAKYVIENPLSEEGWLYLGDLIPDNEKRKYCYERAMSVNPSNQNTRRKLDAIVLGFSPLVNAKNEAPSQSQLIDSSTTKSEQKEGKKYNFVLLAIVGFFAAICVLGLPLAFWLRNKPLLTPQTIISTSTIHYPPTLLITDTQTLTQTPSITPSPMATLDLLAMADPLIAQAKALNSQGQYAEAVQILDKAIIYAPNSDKALYLRATSYHNLLKGQRSIAEYQDYVNFGLSDIDKAITIEPNIGDYYILREQLLISLIGVKDYRADRIHLNNYAAENALTAFNLGATLEEYIDRSYASDLIFAERCEEATQILQEMINKTDPTDISIGGLYHLQSRAYICQDNIDKAISMVKKSMFNNENMSMKNELLAIYLFQKGKYNEALSLMDDLIEQNPNYGGERYYLRSAIRYKLGDRDLAQEDLNFGVGNTWSHVGLYSYVLGEMALEDGRTEEGIELLQNAEATLEVLYNPLRKEIQTELEKLGAVPLVITPSVMVDATSIPTILPQPTLRPIDLTPTLHSSNLTPIPGLTYPSGATNAIAFDPKTGTGKIVLKSNDYPLFRLQPSEIYKVKNVKSIIINVASFTEITPPTLQISMYVASDGGWKFLDTVEWGDNVVRAPEDLIYPSGDMFFAIHNYGPKNVTIDSLTVTIIFESEDGKIIKIGPK